MWPVTLRRRIFAALLLPGSALAASEPPAPDLWASCGNGVREPGEILQTCPRDVTGALPSERSTSGGFARLLVAGTPIPATGLYLYNPDNVPSSIGVDDPEWQAFMRSVVCRVREAGMSYLSLSLPGPRLYRGSAYPDADELADAENWDWAPYDELMDYAAWQGVSIVPTLNLSGPPPWWAADHSDDVQTDSEGRSWDRASFASDSYRLWIGELLTVFIHRYKDHPALLAWDLRVGAGENNYPPPYTVDIFDPPDTWCDYSPGTLERFRLWLRTEYGGDVAALRAAWNEPAVTFGNAELPLPLDEVELETRAQAIPYANSAGDTRRQYHDWTRFRSAQKLSETFFFAQLIRSLDPNHLVFSDPAFAPLESCSIRGGAQDGAELYRSDLLDGSVVHPRIAGDDRRGAFNTSRQRLHGFDRYNLHHRKLALWSQEETSEVHGDSDEEVVWRLRSVMALHAANAVGHGMVTGNEEADVEDMLPAWSESELAEFGRLRGIFTAPGLEPPRPRVALLSDDFHESFTYHYGGSAGRTATESADRLSFLEELFAHALGYDLLTGVDLDASPGALDRYDAVALLDLPRLPLAAAEILAAFRDAGGGLFIGGRTGLYDTWGNPDTAALEVLLGASVTGFHSDPLEIARWAFAGSDPLVPDGDGSPGNVSDRNLYFVPLFDLDAAGYTPLARLAASPSVATVGRKGKTVFWFPQLDIDDTAALGSFQQRLWQLWGQDPGVTAAGAVESTAGSYRYLFTAAPTTVTVALDGSFAGASTLVWDWLSMRAVDEVAAGEPAAEIQSGENTAYFLGFTALNATPQLVAFQGANLHGHRYDPETRRLEATFYRAVPGEELTVVLYPGSFPSPAVSVEGGEVLEEAADATGRARVVRIRPSGELLSFTALMEPTASGCVPGATSLCLNGQRFRVEVEWRDFAGNTGVGRAVPLTGDTGTFWFFDPANVELMVKVLDGRALNGHFWVFYGSLSNVEYTLTITDTLTDEVRVYRNPLGHFGSRGDISAF